MKKKNKAKGGKKKSLLSGAAKSLKKLGKGKMSTTQKVVGGAALVALGLGYWARRQKAASTTPDAEGAESQLAALDGSGI